jgi:hypothetical protein
MTGNRGGAVDYLQEDAVPGVGDTGYGRGKWVRDGMRWALLGQLVDLVLAPVADPVLLPLPECASKPLSIRSPKNNRVRGAFYFETSSMPINFHEH